MDFEHELDLAMEEMAQPEEGQPQKGRYNDVYEVIKSLRALEAEVDPDQSPPPSESQLKLLADTRYGDLEALARQKCVEETMMNDAEAESFKVNPDTQELELEQKVLHRHFDEGLYKAVLANYLELQAKAQELLGRSVPKEKLN